MKNITQFISTIYTKMNEKFRNKQKTEFSVITILSSWQLVKYADNQGIKAKCRWDEIWSFAAMDEAEMYGIYACDIDKQNTIIGKWSITTNGMLRMYYDDNAVLDQIIQLSEELLVLNQIERSDSDSYMQELFFEKIV